MSITRFLNYKQRIKQFCDTYTSISGLKPLLKDNVLHIHYWQELEHLHDHLETFYEATIMVEGNTTGLADHF
jgi:hypothetical protein